MALLDHRARHVAPERNISVDDNNLHDDILSLHAVYRNQTARYVCVLQSKTTLTRHRDLENKSGEDKQSCLSESVRS